MSLDAFLVGLSVFAGITTGASISLAVGAVALTFSGRRAVRFDDASQIAR
jgi:hypothetical protein